MKWLLKGARLIDPVQGIDAARDAAPSHGTGVAEHGPQGLEAHRAAPDAIVLPFLDGVGCVDAVADQRLFDQRETAEVRRAEDEIPVVGVAKRKETEAGVNDDLASHDDVGGRGDVVRLQQRQLGVGRAIEVGRASRRRSTSSTRRKNR